MAITLLPPGRATGTFLDAPPHHDPSTVASSFAVVGVPCAAPPGSHADGGAPPDACDAPAVLRRRSQRFAGSRSHDDGDGDLLGGPVSLVDCGDVPSDPHDPSRQEEHATRAVRALLGRGVVPVVLGGDRSVPAGVLAAYQGSGPLQAIAIGAHPRSREEAGGLLVDAAGVRVHGVDWLLGRLPEDGRFLVTLDVDGLDPSIAPGTDRPREGGLLFHEAAALLRGLAARGGVAGVCVVGLFPSLDVDQTTADTVVRLLASLMRAAGRKAGTAPVLLDGERLRIVDVERIAGGTAAVEVPEAAWQRIARGRAVVEPLADRRVRAYGVTTGVGSHKDYMVEPERLEEFNLRLLYAHATRSPGPVAPAEVVRACMAILVNLFASGRSGVRPALVERLLADLREDRLPAVDLGSSVGASDLVALAQLALPLVGGGELLDGGELGPEERPPGAPVFPAPKEALALVNNNSLTLGRGALVLAEARRLLVAMDIAAALALEGFRGNPRAWSAVVEQAHPQPGHRWAGERLRRLLAGSRLWRPGEPRFLQDPLSFRCVPQVSGAAREALAWTWRTWERELNATVDNPLVDLASGEVVTHGSMETTLLAVTMDALRLTLAKALRTSAERTHKLHWSSFSGLPMGLAAEAGASGGAQFLNLSYIVAAHVATSSIAATPVTPHYHGQLAEGVEDIAGLAPHAVTGAERLLQSAWVVVGIEALVASWAVARRGLAPADLGTALRPAHQMLLPLVPAGREGERQLDVSPAVEALRSLARTWTE
ncbi:MAG TPA: aromatic amino acid lyase [Actinomycetota bacterium]|nr:aromatic amino acid lyase [Actinomycetota bacterium]